VDGARLPSGGTAPLSDGSTLLLGRTRITFVSGAEQAARAEEDW
jgi:hypothetical protein